MYPTGEDTFPYKSETIIERSEYSYIGIVLVCFFTYIAIAVVYHFLAKYQDQKRLKELYVLKQELEEKLNNYKEVY